MHPPIRVYCLLAGSADAATGILLLAAPLRVVALLGLEPIPTEPILLSFVGAFVLAVGLAYLYPFALPAGRRAARIRVLLETTAISRLAVAAFLVAAILGGRLGAAWSTVLLTDLGLAVFQLAYLRRAGAEPAP